MADELRKTWHRSPLSVHNISRVSEYLKLYGSKFDVVHPKSLWNKPGDTSIEVRTSPFPLLESIFDTVDLHFFAGGFAKLS